MFRWTKIIPLYLLMSSGWLVWIWSIFSHLWLFEPHNQNSESLFSIYHFFPSETSIWTMMTQACGKVIMFNSNKTMQQVTITLIRFNPCYKINIHVHCVQCVITEWEQTTPWNVHRSESEQQNGRKKQNDNNHSCSWSTVQWRSRKSAEHGKHEDPKHPTHSVDPPAPPFLPLIPQAANN